MVADINPGAVGGLVGLNIDYGINTSYFFVANDGTTGNEVWVMNATPNSVKQTPAGSDDIKLYPNPATDVVKIELPGNGSYTIEVYNIAGQLVASQPAIAKTTIATDNLANGIYLVKIKNAGGVTIRKFIKQ